MKIIKQNLSLLGRYAVCQVFCFFIVFSFVATFTMIGVQMIGYNAYVISEDEVVDEYVHYYSDGEDTKKVQFEADGYTVKTQEVPGKLEGAPFVVSVVLSQICCLVFFFIFFPFKVYKLGNEDANLVERGIICEDRLYGLKSTVMLSTAILASYVILVLSKLGVLDFGLSVYKISNYYLYGYIELIFGDVTSALQIGTYGMISAFLAVIIVPVSCSVAYNMGLKNVNLYEKIVLKKIDRM
ncbi:MAG: hypothetical protein J6Q67_07870 [Clostridia bacterium]|nr:hypothetical protein [Clostridia bacterium]